MTSRDEKEQPVTDDLDDYIQEVPSHTPDFKTELAEELARLVPEAIADGKVDVEKLRELLEDDAANDGRERFGLMWPGKSRALKAAQAQTTATLAPDREASKDWETTQNVFIEGDNLEVLKILQKHYHGKIKLIYIDPPYNTGNDFIYPDNFKEGVQTYMEWTEQVSKEGKRLTSNLETTGRYHSNWLNMMYPRLKLAKNLLADDGAIFVSIDFNEIDNLKKIMDEIFGESNFEREIIWRIGWLSGYKTMAPNFIRNHDSVLFYSKNSQKLDFQKKYIPNSAFKPLVKATPELNAKMRSLEISQEKQKEILHHINFASRPERYPIEDTWNSSEYDDLNSIAIVSFSGEKISKVLGIDEEIKGQKSVSMLKRVIDSIATEDDLVLDFFSGSGSTAHAVMLLNAEDGGKRRHIQVQLPEPVGSETAAAKAGYLTISDVARERIHRVGQKIQSDFKAQVDKRESPLDIGYRTYRLADTNFAKWRETSEIESPALEQRLAGLRGSSNSDASPEALLAEILLKQGYSLSESISQVLIEGLSVWSVADGAMFAVMDEHVKPSLAQLRAVVEAGAVRLVVLEDVFAGDDQLKTNLVQHAKTHGVELWSA